MPRASIIIRCMNEEEHIGRLLAGVMAQTLTDVEIIVVDSGSTDATLAIASRYPVRIVHIRPEDFSFGRSLNIGCEAASGELLVMASAHVYPVYKDWLEKLLAPFERDDEVGICYGRQRGNEITRYSEHKIFEKWFPDRSTSDQPHPFSNNANCAVRRTLWEQLRYDEKLTGLEDLDFARRAMTESVKVAYVADAEIVHVHEETPKRVYNRYRREAIAHARIFPEQQFSGWDFVRLFVQNTASDYYHAVHEGQLRENVSSIVWFRFMQFFGTWRGFSSKQEVTDALKQKFYYPNAMRRPSPSSENDPSRRIDYAGGAEGDG